MLTLALLLCPSVEVCPDDAEAAAAALPELERQFEYLDLIAERDAGGWSDGVDQPERFQQALEDAVAASEAEDWRALARATATAHDALERWPGTVLRQDLATAWLLRGLSEWKAGEDQSHQRSFRQAAAIWSADPGEGRVLPPGQLPLDARHAALEEVRKLKVGGPGELLVTDMPPGTTVYVDGVPLSGTRLPLSAGTHRVTAEHPDWRVTWHAAAPIAGGRTTAVAVAFEETQRLDWLRVQLVDAVDSFDAHEGVEELLTTLAHQRGVDLLRLVRVDWPRPPGAGATIAVGPVQPTRPAAAAGEAVDLGDGVPTTYEGQVLADLDARREARQHGLPPRVRVAWYEPRTRRFLADPPVQTGALDGDGPTVRVGLAGGWTRARAQHHSTLDLGLSWRWRGPWYVDGAVGVLRAETAYNLYPDWQDRQLYRAAVLGAWSPNTGRLRPRLALGPMVDAPVSLGLRLEAGGSLRLSEWLELGLNASGAVLDDGLAGGTALVVAVAPGRRG